MKIQKITVRAGRTVPHPSFNFGNVRCDLEYHAELDDGDDVEQCRRELQSKVESDVEQHVADLNDGIEDFRRIATARSNADQLEKEIESKKTQLEEMRAKLDDRPLLKGFESN